LHDVGIVAMGRVANWLLCSWAEAGNGYDILEWHSVGGHRPMWGNSMDLKPLLE